MQLLMKNNHRGLKIIIVILLLMQIVNYFINNGEEFKRGFLGLPSQRGTTQVEPSN